MGFAWTTLTGHTTTAEFFIHLNQGNTMDILNLLACYIITLTAAYVVYGVAVSVERALAQVTGHTYASILAEATLATKLAPVKFFDAVANLTGGKAANPRYFG
jgi:hypothetical protein